MYTIIINSLYLHVIHLRTLRDYLYLIGRISIQRTKLEHLPPTCLYPNTDVWHEYADLKHIHFTAIILVKSMRNVFEITSPKKSSITNGIYTLLLYLTLLVGLRSFALLS